MDFKSGIIAIIGRPNTGKTTLLNKLAGQKLGIVTPKPQTTRHRIRAICTDDKSQMIFVDSPGISEVTRDIALDKRVRESAEATLQDADVALALFDLMRPWGEEDSLVAELLKAKGSSCVAAVNKIDLAEDEKLVTAKLDEVTRKLDNKKTIGISAKGGVGIDLLKETLTELLPVGPLYYPEETLTDQPERLLAAEMIREQVMLLTDAEVPYGCAVVVDSYKESAQDIKIAATIIVERESLKGMLIGKGGTMIKAIGSKARHELAEATGKPVHVKLFVKVHKNWRKDPKAVKEFGY